MGKDLNGKELGAGFTQRKNGSYTYRFKDRFGNRKSIYSVSISELRQKARDAVSADYSHQTIEKELTLSTWFKQWLDEYKYEIRDHSRVYYTQIFEKHIKPDLGTKRLQDVKQIDVQRLINRLTKNGYKHGTKHKVYFILLDMFNRAVQNDYAIKNPVTGIRIDKDDYYERRVLTAEEQAIFFNAARGTFYEDLFIVAVETGLRSGELCGLKATDVDFDAHTLQVERTLLYAKLSTDSTKVFHYDPPKTDASKRCVKLSDRCEEALRRQIRRKTIVADRLKARPLEGFEDVLFVTTVNTPLCDQLFCQAIDRIVDQINDSRPDYDRFERFSPHCFRHTFATRCLEAGVNVKVVQQQLGHASMKMTMDLYSHVTDEMRDEELDKFNQATQVLYTDEYAADRLEKIGKVVKLMA